MTPDSVPIAVSAQGGGHVTRPRRCRQCGYLFPHHATAKTCSECGTPSAWLLDEHALQNESERTLRSICRGAGWMALGLWAIIGLFLVNLAIPVIGISTLTQQAFFMDEIAELVIAGLFVAAVPRLLNALRNRPKPIQRTLTVGCRTIAMGAILVGIPSAYFFSNAATAFLGMRAIIPPNSELRAYIDISGVIAAIVGWALCGAGCVIVAQSYLRLMQERGPLRRTFLLIAVAPMLGAVVSAALVKLAFQQKLGVKASAIVNESLFEFALLLWFVVTFALVIAGALNMWRLWRGLGRLV